jgi:hypothetical protein
MADERSQPASEALDLAVLRDIGGAGLQRRRRRAIIRSEGIMEDQVTTVKFAKRRCDAYGK